MKIFLLLITFCFSVFDTLSALKPLPNPAKDLYKDSYWHELYIGDLDYIIERSPKITVEERELITEKQTLDNLEKDIQNKNSKNKKILASSPEKTKITKTTILPKMVSNSSLANWRLP